MNILLIGGTAFVGRTIIETALARGHNLTMFNRGQRNPELFPEIERLHGDRDGGLDVLRGRQWDAVIDTCGYLPRVVRASAELLAGAVERYVFISTISVYADFSERGVDENAPLGTLADPTTEQITGESYGPLKVLCEQVVEQAMPGRALVIRPGLIVGPYDPTDRFTYWPWRIAQGGRVLAPGNPATHVQYIDVRDLAEWTVRMTEAQATGVFNATGMPTAMGELLQTCVTTTGSDAQFTWVPEAALLEQKIEPWSELPLWVASETNPDMAGFGDVSIARAVTAGLQFRPSASTIADTLTWASTRPPDHTWRAGLTRQRETELL